MFSRFLDRSRPAPGRAEVRRGHARLLLAAVGTGSILSGSVILWSGAANAATATVSVSPNSGLASGGSITVSVTTPNATPSNVFVGVTQCGNATSSGTPLTALAADGSDCIGASGFGSTLKVIGAGGAPTPVGPVAAGTYQVTLKLQETGIGTANVKCIAMPPAKIPCQVVASTATTAGAYTGSGSFQGSASMTYANNAVTTTTTTKPTTTTTKPGTTSTTAKSTSTTQAGVGQSISTGVSKSGTPPSSGSAGLTGSGSSALSSGAGSSASGPLASTGPSPLVWVLGLVGLGLLDLGYLAVSATWRTRRAAISGRRS